MSPQSQYWGLITATHVLIPQEMWGRREGQGSPASLKAREFEGRSDFHYLYLSVIQNTAASAC